MRRSRYIEEEIGDLVLGVIGREVLRRKRGFLGGRVARVVVVVGSVKV